MNFFRSLTNICICLYLSILCQFSIAADTNALQQSISDGQTLVSPSQRFELGFFSPGRSKNRYLGIWYKTTPDVVVWVANRNNPLTDSEGIFTISSSGTPVLLNSTNSIIWASNVSRVAASPVVQLLDTGNLVLIDNTSPNLSNYLWQSFDYPGDTRLPGMLMGENSDTGMEQYLTSWRNTDDPSPGDFIYRVENHGSPQLVISMGTRKRFRTGPWNGIQFNGVSMLWTPLKSIMVFNKDRLISFSDSYNDSFITRLNLNQSGSIQRYILDGKKNEWVLMYTIPNNPCDIYGQCGPNGVCNTNTSPLCHCWNGFTPKSPQEWDLLDWSSGCVRIEPPNCENGDGFLMVSGVKFPDMLHFQLKKNMSLSECESECLRNCSCTAYTNPYVSAGNSSCLMWYGDLMDIKEYADEKNEQNVYIRLPTSALESPSGSNMKKRKTKRPLKVVLISAASGVLFLSLVYGCIISKMKRRRKELKRKEEDLELPLFDLTTIAAATRSFSQENMIGRGGFGPVYKGNLSTGQEVAVKTLSKNSGQGAEEFKNEVISIAKLQHRNLVRLLGCCIQGEERMLIYEYMQNKSLDYFIFDPQRSELLNWPKRFDIIMGIARGLLYLHQDSRLKVIHRDLKASNILLDSNLEPKISDFGLARIFGGDQTFVQTKRVVGTYGYMAPEYAMDGKFSEKSDVFSMGALMLEIVSGKKNRSFSHPDHQHNLLGHAWLLWNENRALDLMEACLKDSFVESQVKRCIQVGLLCVQNIEEDRPAISFVLFMLGNEGAILPQPKPPGFFMERSSGNAEKEASGSQGSNTGDMVTITQVEPR